MCYARRTYAALLAGAALWCMFVLLPSFLWTTGETGRTLSQSATAFFRLLCHQLDNRSYHLQGVPLPVCARCASIYFAFLAGTIAYPLIGNLRFLTMPGRALVAIAVLPMLLDAGLSAAGIHSATDATRTFTGGWFGFLIAFLVIPGTIEGVEQILMRIRPPTPSSQKGRQDA